MFRIATSGGAKCNRNDLANDLLNNNLCKRFLVDGITAKLSDSQLPHARSTCRI